MSENRKEQSGAATAASFGFTFGDSHIQKTWSDFQRITWPALVEKLTSHIPGIKEGACIVPARFRGTSRIKESAEQIDVAFLDSDGGMPISEIEQALKLRGWEAVISSTHSHMATVTRVARSNWDRYLQTHPHGDAEAFLLEEKEYRPDVASGAYVSDTTGKFVYFAHRQCPKFRVVVPLERPWVASNYPNQEAANSAWAGRIEALAHALGLPHDQSCTDTSRLFYLPRRPENGAIPETSVIAGKHCDIFILPPPPRAGGLAGTLFGDRQATGRTDDLEYADPATGEIISLVDWARTYGHRFLVATALKAHGNGVLTGHSVDNKIHIDCPNSDEHTDPARDGATFVVNADRAKSKGFVIHCRHAHCTGRDRLFFLRRMLERGWLPTDSLTAPEFLTEHTATPEVEGRPGSDDAPSEEPFTATQVLDLALEQIPPRQWLYGRELLKGFVSVLGSPGGVGKTAHTHGVGVSVALGRPLLAHDKQRPSQFQAVHKTGAVWFYNLEDPADELRRRLKALLLHHGLTLGDFKHPIYMDSGRDRPLIITKRTERGDLVAHPVVDDLVAELKRRGIVLLVVDPFVQSHTAEENRNEEMNLVMALWGQVAHRAGCAVWLIHHFRKGGQAGDGDSFRGAGAIQGAARVMSTLSAMSLEEANKLGIEPDHRRQYVRMDNAKANMAPAADRAEWYRLVSVSIGNGNEDYPDGDSVQTIEPWEPPSPWEGLTWATIERVLARLQEGPTPGERWSPVKQSKERWAGRVLMDIAGKSDGQAFSIIKAWIENGLLETGNYPSPARHGALNACVSVNPAKRAEMRKSAAGGGSSNDD